MEEPLDTNALLNMKTKENSRFASKNLTFTIDREEENVSKATQSFMYEAEIEKSKKDIVEKEKRSRTIIAEQSLQISSLQKSLEESLSAGESLIKETKGYNEQFQQLALGSSKAVQKIQKLQNDLSIAEDEKESLEAQLKETQKLLEEEKLNKINSLEQYKQIMRRLKLEKTDLNKVLTIAVREMEQAQADRDRMSEQLSEALNSNEKLRNEESQRLTKANELIEEKNNLGPEIADLKEKYEENQAVLEKNLEEYRTRIHYMHRTRLAESETERTTLLLSTIKDQMELIAKLETDITNQKKPFFERIFRK